MNTKDLTLEWALYLGLYCRPCNMRVKSSSRRASSGPCIDHPGAVKVEKEKLEPNSG